MPASVKDLTFTALVQRANRIAQRNGKHLEAVLRNPAQPSIAVAVCRDTNRDLRAYSVHTLLDSDTEFGQGRYGMQMPMAYEYARERTM